MRRRQLRDLLGNIRYSMRQFRLSPVFTSAAILTLALGIGGTTAIFTLIDAVMLRSLPVAEPGRLYRVGEGDDCCVEGGPKDRWGMFSFPLFQRLRAEAPEFEEVAAFQAGRGASACGVKASNPRPGLCGRNTSPETISQRSAWEPSVGACLPPATTRQDLRRLSCSATTPGRPFTVAIRRWWVRHSSWKAIRSA